MKNKRILKYLVFFQKFSLEDIKSFLEEINRKEETLNLNESCTVLYDDSLVKSKKVDRKIYKISKNSEFIIAIIHKMKDISILNSIISFLKRQIKIREDFFRENYTDNIGIEMRTKGQKTNLLIKELLSDLKIKIAKKTEGIYE